MESTSGLVVHMRQTGWNPPEVTLSVENASPRAKSFLVWDSPLDPLVGKLGHVAMTRSRTGEALQAEVVKVQRQRQGRDDFAELQPGERLSNVVGLGPMVLDPGDVARGVVVQARGPWRCVYDSKVEEVGSALGHGGAKGAYQSDAVLLTAAPDQADG